jgi:ABC-type sugar transport system substrate-binding protein
MALGAARTCTGDAAMTSKIGLFVNGLDGYPGSIVREVEEAARYEQLEVEVFDTQRSAVRQAGEMMRFRHQNPGRNLCAFVVPENDAIGEGDVSDDPTFRLAQRLARDGVGWVTLNHGREDLVTALRAEFPSLPIAIVAIDNLEFGHVQGRILRSLLPQGGSVLCLRGHPWDTACRDRSAGLRQEVEGLPLVLHEMDARWDSALAKQEVHRWLMSPARTERPLQAVVSQNDPMALAAREALQEAAQRLGQPELLRVPVVGGDGLPDGGLPWVDQGLLTATVKVTLPGKTAVTHLAKYWKDGSPLPLVTRLPVTPYPSLRALVPAPARILVPGQR